MRLSLLLLALKGCCRQVLWWFHVLLQKTTLKPRETKESYVKLEMKRKVKKKHHFVLVHGACHGGWCWFELATLLRSKGHRVTAPDLAASGINLKPLEEIRSISDYFQPLMEVMASLPSDDKVILVGHSMGGLGVAAAMEVFAHKISAAVFASALMPGPNTVISVSQETDDTPNVVSFGPEELATKLYQLSPRQALTLAELLVRPTIMYSETDLLEKMALTTKKYGSVSRVFIVLHQDKMIVESEQREMIEINPVKEVMEIKDSDHMVMLCKPLQLFTCILDVAERYSN
ncbi:hypothetical protein NE237_024142 [Protea cynaroides]|uniref:AB hydrolase-1 domain-containing protein n=1 Tax=Protea cynaroides TaxID=273540 RepID=A0A9Q0K6X6_9MAGN|nr:hypothetical protein NE237_024142 [Protea cynaroides]